MSVVGSGGGRDPRVRLGASAEGAVVLGPRGVGVGAGGKRGERGGVVSEKAGRVEEVGGETV